MPNLIERKARGCNSSRMVAMVVLAASVASLADGIPLLSPSLKQHQVNAENLLTQQQAQQVQTQTTVPQSVTTTAGEVLLLDTTAQVVGGQAYTADATAIIIDGSDSVTKEVYTEDVFAKLDEATGNVLTILDPLNSSEYSVVTKVLQKDGKYYTYDPTSFAVTVGDSEVAFTLDYFAYIDPNTLAVYTESGEKPLPSAPRVDQSAVDAAERQIVQAEQQQVVSDASASTQQAAIPQSVTTTAGEVLLLDTTAQVIEGQAFTADDTAIIIDGSDGVTKEVFTEDVFAKLDEATGNVLTILDPLNSSEYSVVTKVLQKDGKYYTYDPTSFAVTVGDSEVAFTLDYFAYIDPNTLAVYTESGEKPLPSAPRVDQSAVDAAERQIVQAQEEVAAASEPEEKLSSSPAEQAGETEEASTLTEDVPAASQQGDQSSIVLGGQEVIDTSTGKTLLLIDPSLQAYTVTLVDSETKELTSY